MNEPTNLPFDRIPLNPPPLPDIRTMGGRSAAMMDEIPGLPARNPRPTPEVKPPEPAKPSEKKDSSAEKSVGESPLSPPAPEPKWVKEAIAKLITPSRKKGLLLAVVSSLAAGGYAVKWLTDGPQVPVPRNEAPELARNDDATPKAGEPVVPTEPGGPHATKPVAPVQDGLPPENPTASSADSPTTQNDLPPVALPNSAGIPNVTMPDNPTPANSSAMAIPTLPPTAVPSVPGSPTAPTNINVASNVNPAGNTGGPSNPPTLTMPSVTPSTGLPSPTAPVTLASLNESSRITGILPVSATEPADNNPAPASPPSNPTLPNPGGPSSPTAPSTSATTPTIPDVALPGSPTTPNSTPELPTSPTSPTAPASTPMSPLSMPTLPTPAPSPALPSTSSGLPSATLPIPKTNESNPGGSPQPVSETVGSTLPRIDPTTASGTLPVPNTSTPPANTGNPFREEPAAGAGAPSVPPVSQPITGLQAPSAPAGTLNLTKPAEASTVRQTNAIEAKPFDYDVDLYEPAANDTYATISKLHFGDARYAQALQAYNRNAALGRGIAVEIPPLHILRKRYAQLLGNAPATENPERGTQWAPAGGRSLTTTPTYTVTRRGMTFRDVANEIYGDRRDWQKVWDENRNFKADEELPTGTRLKLPANAPRIQREE